MSTRVMKIGLFILLIALGANNVDSVCPRHHRFFEDSGGCYRVGRLRQGYNGAAQWCRKFGAQLVSIHTPFQDATAASVCGLRMCWIGLTEMGGDASTPKDLQVWKWEDGNIMTYADWQPGEPNNYGGKDERYGFMNLDMPELPALPKVYSGKWFDGPARLRAHPLCKFPIAASTRNVTRPPLPRPAPSPSDVTYTLLEGRFTAKQARTACGPGKRLAMPKTRAQVHQLVRVARVAGKSFSSHTGFFLGGHENNSEWTWDDGSSIAEKLWFPGQPGDEGGKETQLCTWVFFHGRFHDCPDHGEWGTLRVICENGDLVPMQRPSLPAPAPSKNIRHSTCKDNFTERDGSCYLIDTGRKGYFEALSFCRSKRSSLVSIHDEREDAIAKSMCGRRMCWIGLTERGGTAATPRESQTWRWEDGDELEYANWAPGEPNNYNGVDEKFAFMNLDFEVKNYPTVFNGKWYDGSEFIQAHAICQTHFDEEEEEENWFNTILSVFPFVKVLALGLLVGAICVCVLQRNKLAACIPRLGYSKMPAGIEPRATEMGHSYYVPPTSS